MIKVMDRKASDIVHSKEALETGIGQEKLYWRNISQPVLDHMGRRNRHLNFLFVDNAFAQKGVIIAKQ